MKKKITHLIAGMLFAVTGMQAQSISCTDTNGFVSYKNAGPTGYYTLNQGYEEKAAQTYFYSGPGKVSAIKLYGNYPSVIGGAALKVSIYNVDANRRPTSLIQSTNTIWWPFNNVAGYKVVSFGSGGVSVSANFAVEVELNSNAFPFGHTFQVQYDGDGEGGGQDLMSLAGTGTGNNWVSALTNFIKDGDLYLVPIMTNYITTNFTPSSICATVSNPVNFTNTSAVSADSMFNTLSMQWYTGPNHIYEWDFGDGSPKSYIANPTHAYSTAGAFTVSLTTTLVGWTHTCSSVKTMRISVGLGANVTSVVNVTCNGQNNGGLTAAGIDGIPPYAYRLSNGPAFQLSNSFSGLTAGNYTLIVMDSNGCTANANITITQPSAIVFTNTGTTLASCGISNGAILVAASGGSGGIQYKLNNGPYQGSGSFTGLAGGAYTITAKDNNGCTASEDVAIGTSGTLSLSVVSQTYVSCNNGNDGTIVLNGTGGSGILQYSINGGATYQTSGSFTGLYSGSYACMVKDAAGCTQTIDVLLTQPSALALTASATTVSCNGGNDGQIDVTSAIGGTGSFSYSVNGSAYQSGTHFQNLIAGTYTVYVKDAASCIGTTVVQVNQPTALAVSAVPTGTSCNGSNDGTITVTASGGTGSYNFGISSGDPQPTATFTELAAGTYTLTVTDANGCSVTTSATVTQPSLIAASLSTTSSTCGNSNGGLLAVASGGSGFGYTYSLDGITFQASGSFSNLMAGTYYVTVKDGSGCENTFSSTVFDANGPVITSQSKTNVGCNGGNDGTITINTVTGGTGTLQYSVDGINWQLSSAFTGLSAGTYTVTVKDVNGCSGIALDTLTQPAQFVIYSNVTNLNCNNDLSGAVTITASGGAGSFSYSIDGQQTWQTSTLFSNLAAGSYTVAVRDVAGCIGTSVFTITQPSPINMSNSVLDVTCHGADNGSISLYASGGNGIYQYSIDGVNYQSGNTFSGLSGGNYRGYVKDAHGCIQSLMIRVNEPAAILLASISGDVSCTNGTNGYISLNVSGGTPPYIYNWSEGSTAQGIFNLTAGTYSVTVTDDNGCTSTASYVLTQPANPIVLNGVVTNATSASSSDGGVSLSVNGGVGPYSYLWSNGETSQNLLNASAGTYTVRVTDNNGCETTMQFVVSIATGISGIAGSSNEVNMYPNPTNDITTLDAGSNIITSVKIMDITGQVVSYSEPKAAKTEISCSALAQGIYLVQIEVNGNLIHKRLDVTK